MADLRFCAYQYQHLPLDALRGRWRDAERSGFDVLWNCDTVVEPDRPRHTMFDGPATLTMMAADTSRVRIGTLVTSLYFRQPVPFAKASVTVDHLSGGRVELALGVGDPSAGAKAGGVAWPAGERVARFREFVVRCPRFSGQGSNMILAGKERDQVPGKPKHYTPEFKEQAVKKVSTPRRHGQLPRWRGNSISTIPRSGSG